MSVNKPKVCFKFDIFDSIKDIEVGKSARVWPVNHPREHLNKGQILTSRVISVDALNETFETLNTIYVCVGIKEE